MINPITLYTYIKTKAGQLSQTIVYTVFLLYHAYKRPDTPAWAKRIVLGAIIYFVSPIDSIPDILPMIGYTDDLSVLSLALVNIACYINDEVRVKSRASLKKIFKNIDDQLIEEVDDKL